MFAGFGADKCAPIKFRGVHDWIDEQQTAEHFGSSGGDLDKGVPTFRMADADDVSKVEMGEEFFGISRGERPVRHWPRLFAQAVTARIRRNRTKAWGKRRDYSVPATGVKSRRVDQEDGLPAGLAPFEVGELWA